MEKLVILRRHLHQHPELSGQEFNTVGVLEGFFNSLKPDNIIRFPGTGMAILFKGKKPGPTTVFRSEIDALPIEEESLLTYRSENSGISHACGHDGHMSIMAGLGEKISAYRPKAGTVVILFQPAEETGQGAHEIMQNKVFSALKPDRIFALHNIPGSPENTILMKKANFSAASTGMIIRLFGKSSHAAEPGNGQNPSVAVARLIKALEIENNNSSLYNSRTFGTVIHILLGEKAFGTSPGKAEVCFTLRSFENRDIGLFRINLEKKAVEIAKGENLKIEIEYTEKFPSVENDPECNGIIENAALELQLPVDYLEEPFLWSEDFGYFTEKYKGGFFGLGAGVQHSALHNPDYDFEDRLIETGSEMFFTIYKQIHQ